LQSCINLEELPQYNTISTVALNINGLFMTTLTVILLAGQHFCAFCCYFC